MPRGDRTGPWGLGPRTGRGAGYCGGYDAPGFMQARGGRAFGGGRGFGYASGPPPEAYGYGPPPYTPYGPPGRGFGFGGGRGRRRWYGPHPFAW